MFQEQPYSNLLEESFPGMKSNMLRCEQLGFPWASKPFFKEDKGEVLSHEGFLEYPILIEGTCHKAGALHAICTKITHHGQGLASQLIQEVLQWAKDHMELLMKDLIGVSNG